MLNVEIDRENSIVILEPDASLKEEDFKHVTNLINKHLLENKKLRGVIIHADHFPGWENMSGFVSHLKFVRDHHKEIPRVAVASDSKLLSLVPHIADHFINAEVKHYAFDQIDQAKSWILE